MKIYSFKTAKKILFGLNSVKDVGEELKKLKPSKVAIITDKGVRKAGISDGIADILNAEKIDNVIWDEVESEPSIKNAEAAIFFVREEKCDGIIGVGGGSTLDVSKATAVSLKNKGLIKEWIKNIFRNNPSPFILIPTTAGTGSEVSNVAIFATKESKYALYSSNMYPDVAIVDPGLTRTISPSLTARTGIDALCHALEAYLSLNSNPITDCLALESIKNNISSIRSAFTNGDNMEARIRMSYAALVAGLAFGNAGTVLGHACGYAYVWPATNLHLPHGLAIGTTMPYVLEYNALANIKKTMKITKLLGESCKNLSERDIALKSALGFKKLLLDLNMPTSLKEVGITKDLIPFIAKNVFKSPKHVARNPRKVLEQDMIKLFVKAYDGALEFNSK